MTSAPITDAARAVDLMCTHVCRSRPGLKLSLAACEKRRAAANQHNLRGTVAFNPLWECRGCEGAIPIEGQGVQEVEQNPLQITCKVCGATPQQTKFYPSRVDRCAECIKAAKRNRAAENRKYQEVEPMPSSLAQKSDPVEPAPTVTCKGCGEQFTPWKNGGVTIKTKCRECVKGARRIGWESNMGCSYILRLNFLDDAKLLEVLGACAKKERRTVDQQVMVILEGALLKGGEA